MENNVPNLDSLTCKELWDIHSKEGWKYARELFPDRPTGYVKAAMQLCYYASNKATAQKLRLEGRIDTALIYESICDTIYDRLPEWARW